MFYCIEMYLFSICVLRDLRDLTFPAEKKTLTVRQGHIKRVQCFRVLLSQKWRGYLDIYAVNATFTASHRNYLVSVYIHFWALIMT